MATWLFKVNNTIFDLSRVKEIKLEKEEDKIKEKIASLIADYIHHI